MSGWGTNGNANRIKDTYIRGFLDVSGGSVIVEKTSSLQIISHDSDNPVLEFKSEYFTVNTTSSVDVSYSALAALGVLGVSFEQSTADITGRVKYITAGEIGSVPNQTLYTQIGNDDENCDLQVYGLIRGHYGMLVDGDVSLNSKLFVNGDSSMNGNISIRNNLYVSKNSTFILDVSMNGNLDIGSGRSFVAINKDISAGFALDVSGVSMFRNKLYVLSDVSLGSKLFVSQDSSLNGNLAVGRDLSLNGNLYVSGIIKNYYTSSAIDASFVLKTYVDTSLNTNYYTRTVVDASVNSGFYNRSAVDASFVLKTYVDTSLNTNYYIRSAIDASVNSGFYNRSAVDASFVLKTYVDTSLNTNYYTRTAIDVSVNSGFYNRTRVDASFVLKTYVDTSLNTNYYTMSAIDASVNSNFYNRSAVDASFVLKTYVDTSLNTNYYTRSAIDASVNGNFYNRTRVDASFVLKTYVDTSLNTNYYTMSAIDASVNSNFYNRTRVDASFVLKTYVDTSLNTNYYTRTAIDASINSGFYNKSAVDASFALKTYIDTSLNTNYYIRSAIDASVNSNFYNRSAVDASFALKTYVDTSLNTNYYMRTAIDASVNSNFYNRSAVDASFALKTYVDTSLNTNYYTRTAIDASFALKTYVDTSLNTNYYTRTVIDASVNSNFYNRTIIDASLSGIVSSGGIVTILTDTSLNGNVRVGRDLSLNGNLFVVGRSVFGLDVSMNGNLDIGSGNNSVAINKDISAGYALDVSGLTIFRNKMYVASDVSFGSTLIVAGSSSLNGGLAVTGTLTLNGAPVSGGSTSSLTGNVQVGSNSGFVTVDKPQFYSDPSLIIYYDFDTSFNSGTSVRNIANPGTYDGTLTGTPAGMIDTSEKKWGTASLKQNTTASNDGVTISSTIPVSNTFSVSLWVKKSGNSSTDRLFEFSNVASGTGENNTIALNINTSGKLVPIITNGSGSVVTLSNYYIYNYNIGDNNWNNIVWIVTSGKSFIYVNGSIGQIDTVGTITNVNNRTYGFIARTNNTTGYAVENANIDDFRYYKDKALNYAEIYQLYNNNFYTFDICGGFLANGSSVIYEPSGSKATASSGTLTLLHGDVSGSSSIMFKSVNDPLEYGYIQYEENSAGSTGNHFGLMTIGIENDGGSLNYTQQADRVSLFPSGGQGFVGVNTKTPQCSLDVSGTLNTNMDASINGVFVGKGGGNNSTNTRLGFEALKTNTSGYTNVAIGYQALTLNNTGYQNVAVGSSALQSHTAINCTAVGASALYTNSNGYNNVAVGSFSLYTNSTGYSNVAVGSFALEKHTSTNCTAVGASALNANSTGYNNVAVGTSALQNITTQNSNTAIGFAAGNGSGNTFVGNCNTFIGSNTYQNGTGIENTYIGYGAGSLTGNYSGSTAIGIGSQITGNNQIVLGRSAEFVEIPGGKININPVSSSSKIVLRGDNNGTGNSFVLCNGLSSVLSSNRFGIALESASNTAYPLPFQIQQNGIIGIGYTNQSLTGSYALDISGNVNVTGNIIVGNVSATSYNATSDYRIKKNVMPLDLTFNVDVLKPVSYVLKDDKDSKLQIGFIAHEVQEFYPFLVNGVKDGEDTQSINYNGFIGILTKEIKVLKNKVAGQEAKLLDQEARIQALEKLLNK